MGNNSLPVLMYLPLTSTKRGHCPQLLSNRMNHPSRPQKTPRHNPCGGLLVMLAKGVEGILPVLLCVNLPYN